MNDNDQGFVRTRTSSDPETNPTFVDEGNNEVFTVEQLDGMGQVHQLVLTPVQAQEMRDKIDSWLRRRKPFSKRRGHLIKVAAALPAIVLAACR